MAKQQYPYEVGRVVKSLCGRDEGEFFVVISILKEGFALIANGKNRKIATPKRKKTKHLYACETKFESIAAKLVANQKVFDSEIASALRKHEQNLNGVQGECINV